MVNAVTQLPTNRSWPRKRRRQAMQAAPLVRSPDALPGVSPQSPAQAAQADTAAVAKPAARRKPFRHLVGRKYIKLLQKYISDLRRIHPHPNRDLYLDDIVTILLLGFFNSDIRSLRKLELYSQVPGVNKSLNVDRVCRSTLAEGLKLFDPSLLAPLLQEIYQAIPNRHSLDP
ncbi:MAG: hypothetical protein ACP5I8_07535, partial [Phycisphaerae bacterium]